VLDQVVDIYILKYKAINFTRQNWCYNRGKCDSSCKSKL